MEEKNYEAALEAMRMILYLHREHDFALPDGFQSKYAHVSRFTQDSCTGKELEAKCWKALTNQSVDVTFGIPMSISQNETVTWICRMYPGAWPRGRERLLGTGVGASLMMDDMMDDQLLTESTGQLLDGNEARQMD